MNFRIRQTLSSLQTRLTLIYTIVTVAALFMVVIALLGWLWWWLNSERANEIEYLDNVFLNLAPEAEAYFEQNDFAGLQIWAEERYSSNLAAPPETEEGDVEAAPFAIGHPFLILDTTGEIVALAPFNAEEIGSKYVPNDQVDPTWFSERSLNQTVDILEQYRPLNDGSWHVVFPVQSEVGSKVWGTLVLNIEPSPSFLSAFLSSFGVLTGLSAIILLVGVIPLGILFGYIMAKSLTHRLAQLEAIAEAYSQGDFSAEPDDNSQDEIGRLGMRLKQMAKQIEMLLVSRQELAALEERNRLARELHDTVKQQNFATLMQVRAAKNLAQENCDLELALDHLEMAENMLKQSRQDLKAVIEELRPAQLEGHGLAEALRRFAFEWSKHSQIQTDLSISGERPLPLLIEQALFRIAQETFSNIDRHSDAKKVGVNLSYGPDWIALMIKDDGIGFKTESIQHGFGLSTIQQRVTEVNGRLELMTDEGIGTRLLVEIDL